MISFFFSLILAVVEIIFAIYIFITLGIRLFNASPLIGSLIYGAALIYLAVKATKRIRILISKLKVIKEKRLAKRERRKEKMAYKAEKNSSKPIYVKELAYFIKAFGLTVNDKGEADYGYVKINFGDFKTGEKKTYEELIQGMDPKELIKLALYDEDPVLIDIQFVTPSEYKKKTRKKRHFWHRPSSTNSK